MRQALHRSSQARFRVKRRALLAALGASSLGGFLPRLGIAQAATPIKRLVLVFQPNGVIMDTWRPPSGTPAGAPIGQLSRTLAAFEPVKSKIAVITGLDQRSYGADNHQQGMGGLWTGSRMGPESELSKPAPENGALADGMSIDQAVAQANVGKTRFDSLQFQVDRLTTGGLGPGWMTGIYSGPSQPMLGENNPYEMFDRIFEGVGSVGVGMSDQGAQLRAERKSVLDRVATELTALTGTLGATDRLKLDQHLTHVRSIERRLVDGSVMGASCEPTSLDAALADEKEPLDNDNYPAMVRLHTDIAMLALRCDLTRVLSLQFSFSVSGINFKWVESGSSGAGRDHHEHSHDWDTVEASTTHLSDIDRWYAEQVAYLAQSLDAVQDGEATLLDNTCIVWGNEIARGGHTLDDMPFLVAGGAAHGMPQGKVFDFQGTDTLHNRLLVSLGRGMGLELDRFGTGDESSGGLPGFV